MGTFVQDMEIARKKIAPMIDRWHELLVPQWQMHVEWHYDRSAEYFASVAWVSCDWRYLDACINVSLPRACALPEEDYEGIVVHEITHLLVNEMREWERPAEAIRHEERVVTTLSRILHQHVTKGKK